MADTKASKEITIIPTHTLPSEKAEDYRVIYANSFRAHSTSWDIQISVGRLEGPVGRMKLIELAMLYISPGQAKAFLNLLGMAIGEYEDKFGEIKVDPRLTTPIRIPTE